MHVLYIPDAVPQMAVLLQQGEEFKALLYTFRSCSKAMPMIKGDEPEELRKKMHRQTFEILRPRIAQLLRFDKFQTHAIKIVTNNVSLLVKHETSKQVRSNELMRHVARCVDLIVILNSLKDMRSSILNDYSRYKRAHRVISQELNDNGRTEQELHGLQMFLTHRLYPSHFIIQMLRESLQKHSGYDLVLISLIKFCYDCIVNKKYITPEEKFGFHRVIPIFIFLLDSHQTDYNPFKQDALRLGPIQKLYKSTPIVPLYGDMQLEVIFILRLCSFWDEDEYVDRWTTRVPAKLGKHYELKYHKNKIREQYTSIVTDYTALLNEIREYTSQGQFITPVMLERVFDVCVEAFESLSAWTCQVKEQLAWKYSRPVAYDEYLKMGGKDGPMGVYERCVKYNFSGEDKYHLVDVIGMIKGLAGLMLKTEVLYVPLLRRYIHDECQLFLQKELARPMRKAQKRSRQVLQTMLDMRDIAGDWLDPKDKNDYLTTKKEILGMSRDFPRRATAPTHTQITLIRRMMHTIFDPTAEGMTGGFLKDKDLKKEWVPAWERFYSRSFYFKYLLDYTNTIKTLSDMSFLWYREFYLELTKSVQFSISNSLPWILTEFVIKTPAMKENIFFPMDIYNDAAALALGTLKQRFLYDEVEAELNLSFAQLIFQLTDDVFKYFKTLSSSILIDKAYERKFDRLKNRGLSLVSSRYITLISQRHIVLLGRAMDIQARISEQINSKLRDNLEMVIANFESKDLTYVVQFRSHLANVKLTHALLSEYLNIDPWDELFKEVNHDTSVGHFRGRAVWHIAAELVADVIPNYVWNEDTGRYAKGPIRFVDPPTRPKAPSGRSHYWYGTGYKEAFDRQNSLYKSYFGVEHIEAILDVVSKTVLPMFIHEVVDDIAEKIVAEFSPFVERLTESLTQLKLPGLYYGVVGGYGYFDMKLQNNIGAYEDMRPEVLQRLREIGNAFIFVRLLDSAMTKRDDLDFAHIAFHMGILPRVQTGSSHPSKQPPASPFLHPPANKDPPFLHAMLQGCSSIGNIITRDRPLLQDQINSGGKARDLYTPDMENTSLVSAALSLIAKTLHEHELVDKWGGVEPLQGELIELNDPKDFVRIWSALQFLVCQPPVRTSDSPGIDDLATFGDGFFWAGCLINHLLGFRQRFELLDFSYHVLRLAKIKPLPPAEAKKSGWGLGWDSGASSSADDEQLPAIRDFLDNVKWVKETNNSIFAQLESYFPSQQPEVMTLHPPTPAEFRGEAKRQVRGAKLIQTTAEAAAAGGVGAQDVLEVSAGVAGLSLHGHGHSTSLSQSSTATDSSSTSIPPPPPSGFFPDIPPPETPPPDTHLSNTTSSGAHTMNDFVPPPPGGPSHDQIAPPPMPPPGPPPPPARQQDSDDEAPPPPPMPPPRVSLNDISAPLPPPSSPPPPPSRNSIPRHY